jgi:pimeloyl-ACP methyl ester carboxylesterase
MPGRRFAFAFMAAVLAVSGVLVAGVWVRAAGDALERPGIDSFYAQPPGAAEGAPGTLVKTDELLGTPLASRAWRIMYRSTTAAGDPVVVTGTVIVPWGPPPPGGRTVVSWGHPTTGSARECAPSYGFDPFIGIEGLRSLLYRGYAVVATDYTGMGTDGPDSYLVGGTAGNNVLDAVRAARELLGSDTSDRVILWGHSQGGQAALFAAELAPQYAPELDIRAVAVAAPAANLTDLMSAHLDDISGVTIGSYAFQAFADTYGDSVSGAQVDTILTPEAVAILPQMNELCLLTNIPELHRIGEPFVGHFTSSDPSTTPPWAQLLAENSAGSTAFDAPLFVAQGLDDTLVIPTDTADFVRHEASLGISVTYEEISFATHGTVAYLALPGMLQWLDRVTGRTASLP